MSTQHARQFSRRRFLGGLTLVGTAGFLGWHPRPVPAEPPPETTTLRLVQGLSLCGAPQYVAEELLQAKGFLEVHSIKTNTVHALEVALASGDAHLGMHFAAPPRRPVGSGGSDCHLGWSAYRLLRTVRHGARTRHP